MQACPVIEMSLVCRRGLALCGLGDEQGAIECLREALEANSEQPKIKATLEVLLEKGSSEGARKKGVKAVEDEDWDLALECFTR